jgi:hypothetical protein
MLVFGDHGKPVGVITGGFRSAEKKNAPGIEDIGKLVEEAAFERI